MRTMLIPPGVEVLVNDCLGTEDESPSVMLKELLSLMSDKGITVATILPMTADHLIVVGYADPGVHSDPRNAKGPPAAGERPEGKRR